MQRFEHHERFRMKPDNLNSMSAEALWRLYENVVLILTQRMTADRTRLDQRLQKIRATDKLVRPSRSHTFVPRGTETQKTVQRPGPGAANCHDGSAPNFVPVESSPISWPINPLRDAADATPSNR
ncbi:hypothetical protein [Bradyrhizobium centrolobii]|uniref:hypothetical protein n=1 Tax=Bradyrhizobium TaxID=374 RepID=UPI003D310B8D